MKVIYLGKLYYVRDEDGDSLLLDGDNPIWINYDNPDLLIDPTDGEISYLVEGEEW